MANIVKSARGERVDFDLLSIKSSMAAIPITDNVQKRERFINKKRRRGLKRKVDEMAQSKRLEEANFASAVEQEQIVAAKQEPTEETPTQRRRKVGK